MRKKVLCMFSILLFVFCIIYPQNVMAMEKGNEESQIIYIHDALSLFHIYDNPGGNYCLTADIDMKDLIWLPIPFYGTLDGNGHAIKNLSVTTCGADVRTSYDGNYKTYDTVYAGLFSVVENATIKNLTLSGLHICMENPQNCFAGGIAGYMHNSLIEQCSVESMIDLTTSSHMFGIGGIAGFGNGIIRNCRVDTTLICTDTNIKDKDEQFLGGIFGDGLFTMENNTVYMNGYISDHGYVHSGGMGGMIISYEKNLPLKEVMITGNTVIGKITFFEDNRDRRAYCKDIIGEYMYRKATIENNTAQFIRDERFDYSVNLRP